MNTQNKEQALDLSAFGTKVDTVSTPVSGSAEMDFSSFGTKVEAAPASSVDVDGVGLGVSDKGYAGRRVDDVKRGWNRAMQGIDIQQLDRRSGTNDLLDQIDAGTYQEPVERWQKLSEDPRAKQYRLAGQEERARIRSTLGEKMDEDVADLIDAEQSISQLPQSEAVQKFGAAEDFGSAWDALTDSPVEVISSLATESLGQQAPYLPLMAANPALGAGVGSYVSEKGADIINSLREAGVDLSSDESIREGLSNQDKMASFRQHAARRGLAIGLVDAISGGIAGKFAAGATSTVGKIARGAGEDLVMQPAMGAAGEAAGALAAGDEISAKDMLAEAAGEIGPGAVETAAGTIQNSRKAGQVGNDTEGSVVDDIDAETGEPLSLPTPDVRTDPEQVRALPPSEMTYGDGFVTGTFTDLPEPAPSQIGYEEKLALPPSRTVYDQPPLLEGPQGDALPSPENVYGDDFVMSPQEDVAPQDQLPSPDQYGRSYGDGFVAGDELLPPAPGPNYVAMVDRNGRQTGWYNPETAHAVGKELGAFEAPRRNGPTIDDMMADGRNADEIRAELVEQARQERAAADVGSVVRIKVPGKRTAEAVRVVGFTDEGAVVETKDGQKVAIGDEQIPKPQQMSLDLTKPDAQAATVVDDIQKNRLVAEIEQAALQAQAPASEAQAEAGNYRKGHVKVGGLDIAIENPRGSTRPGTDADGNGWSVEMPAHYGYIKRTSGADGDHVDVYVGPEPESDQVYVIDQIDHKTGKFDEHKVMIGYPSSGQAQADYRRAFNDGRGILRMGAVTPMSMADFKAWIKDGDTKNPLAYQAPENNVTRSRQANRADTRKTTTDETEKMKSASGMTTASWVIRNKSTGEVVMETFDRAKVDALNTDKYEAVPIQEHLASLNKPKPDDTRPPRQNAKTDTETETPAIAAGVPDSVGMYDLDAHKKVISDLQSGGIAPAELVAAYKEFMENFDAIKAEMAKLTKAELARYSLRGKNEKKDMLVSSAMDALRGQYNTKDSISYSPFEQGSKDAAYLKAVEETTADDIARFAKRVADAKEARSAYAAEINKAISNPETYDEFKQFVRYRGADALTDEQRARYDELIAEKNHADRQAQREDRRKVSAVDIGDTDMEIVETKHTRDGYDLFVVRLGDRVEKDVYKDLLSKAKQLGGWYSRYRGNGAVPGFQFKSRENAEAFVALRDGDTLKPDKTEDKTAKATDQLREAAAKISEKADEKLSADRKVNTARRASMAANAEADANKDKMIAETMNNIADAIENGNAKHLSQIRFRTDVDMLNSLLRQAQYERIRTEKIKTDWDDLPAMSAEDVKYVKYPFPSGHGDHVTSVSQAMLQMSGFKLVGKRLQDKALNVLRSGSYRVEFKTDRDIADFDKMVQAAAQAKSIGSYIADDLKEAKANYGRAIRLGLPDTPTLRAALREFLEYRGAAAKVDPVKAAERALIGTNISGYFPTPRKLVERMIDEAGIEEGMTVLEPSAGKGSIADMVREKTDTVDVVEPYSSLRSILEAKGHNIVGSDFLDFTGKYDRIIMNPPFEKRQDVDHVRHAYDQLAPGGRLVAIMSEGPFFGSDKKAVEFREWLEVVGGVSEKNPDGSFKDSDRATGVATRLVTIDRSDERYSLKRDTGDVTKTDAFKRWFGDSKVVDSAGDPLVVYYGTSEDFEAFSASKSGAATGDKDARKGFFFSSDPEVAGTYADTVNPYGEGKLREAYAKANERLLSIFGTTAYQNGGSVMPVYLAINNPYEFDYQGKGYDSQRFADIIDAAKEAGHDGVIIRNARDDGFNEAQDSALDIFVAFRPDQIKSTNNRGSFDRADPRILYRISNQTSQKRTQLEEAVIAEIKRLAPSVNVETRANGKTLIGGEKADGGYIPVDDLIWTAMDASDPTHAGRHEVVHHLRATGRITEAEWSILQRKAKLTWRKQYRVEDYRDQYAGINDIETALDEEAVAEAFADWMEGGSDAKGGVARIFRKIKQFFDRIASVVRGQGYTSAEDVFRSIDEGEVGSRASNDIEKMKQQRAEYFAMSGLRKKTGSATAKPKQKASPLSDAQDAAIKRTMANIEDEQPMGVRIRETLTDAVDYIKHGSIQHIFDQFDSIKRYEKATYGELKRASMSAYKMARMTTNLQSTMAAVLRHGPLEYKNGAFQVRSGFDGGFEAIFADLADRGLLKAWKGWAVAQRASRLAKEGRENNMTAADIALLKDLDKQYPEFRDVMKRWTAFNKAMLDMSEQTGLLDPEARALFESDDYVPFYRAIDDKPTGPFGKKGLANQRSGINRLKGGEAEVNDLIDNMVRNMTQLVDASMKNVAAKRVMRTLKTAGLDDGSVIMKVPHDAVPVHVTPEEAAQALENIGVQVQGMSKQQHDRWLKLFTLRPPKDPDVVSVMVGGKPQYFRVNDPLLLAAMTSLGTERVHWLVSILGYPKRWLTTGVTATPGFMLRNFIRDSLHGWVVSGENFTPGIDGFKGAIRSYREETALVNIMAAGGGSGGFFRTQSRDVAKMLSKTKGKATVIDSPKMAWEWWKRVGQATENANRIAIYDSVLKDTGDVAEAAFQALDIMDFSMRGDSAVIRFLIGTIPFLNARMQGLYRLGRGVKEKPKAFMLRGGLITAATMLLYSLNADDERYDELPEWEKDAYYHIFLDRIFPEDALKAAGIPFDEFHIRLPKPFEVGALFSTIPERATRLAQGKDDIAIYGERMWSMMRDTFAVDLPQFVKPLAEQWANEVTFTGSPIVPERMQDLAPEAQYDARTSELAKQIGDALPDFMGDAKSPKRIDAAVRAFFGSYGVYVMGIADEVLDPIVGNPVEPELRADQMPELGGFVRQQPLRSTRFVSEFYDLKREIEAVAKTYKQYRSQGQIEDAKDITRDGGNKKIAMAGWMRRKAKQMSGINKKIRSVEESRSLTSAQKRTQIDQLSEQRNELAEQVVKALNKAGIK